jgi:heme-degrading monooxygenase HmoA
MEKHGSHLAAPALKAGERKLPVKPVAVERKSEMMVVVFRAHRTPDGLGEEYKHWFERMTELACSMPGYISHKGYVAEDGERLTLFEWESAEALKAWAAHPEHIPVKMLGRQKFYTDYHLQVCELVRESKFERGAG